MKTILLIRHGMTAGNLEKRYIGRTDEPLCASGEAQANALAPSLPRCDIVFTSPLFRCRQTAGILFPEQEIHIIQDLRECDFGLFEGKTASELVSFPAYTEWLSTKCTAPIPGGEDVSAFKARSARAFARAAFDLPESYIAAFVLHGGCIMAILEFFAWPRRAFYDSHIGNCQFVICACEKRSLRSQEDPYADLFNPGAVRGLFDRHEYRRSPRLAAYRAGNGHAYREA
jgi:alpha-ribazole phosphatase